MYLLLIFYFFATFYSLPPIRFKESGFAGLLIMVLVQYPIPTIMVFSVFDSFGTIDMWGFVLFSTIIGATQGIGHQRYDLDRDTTTQTGTFAVRQGHSTINRLYKIFVFLDMISMIGILVVMSIELKTVNIYGQDKLIVPLLILYLVFALIVTRSILREKKHLVDPYYVKGRNDIFNITFTLFPNFFLPFYLSCVLAIVYPVFVIFTIIFLFFTFISFPNASITRQIKVVYNTLKTSISKRRS